MAKRGLTKIYSKLTVDQKRRGVYMSSQLKVNRSGNHPDDAKIKEVFLNDPKKFDKERLLKDDSFFTGSHWNYNMIRT